MGITPAKASTVKMRESRPWPTRVEPMVRLQSQRPAVATFSLERTKELASSPTR
jgi:hypothetical protein